MDIHQFDNNTEAVKQDEAVSKSEEQREAKPSDTAENVKSDKSVLPDEFKLAILTTAHISHTQRFESLWKDSVAIAEKVNRESALGESELGCKLRAYVAFAKSIASTTLQILEQRKLLTVNGDREKLVLELSSSPVFILASTSMIADLVKTQREKCADAL